MEISIQQLTKEEVKNRKVHSWPVWSKQKSIFPWTYDSTEECYIISGSVTVHAGGMAHHIKAGDFVIFPAGLSCEWEIHEDLRKHYNFPG